MDVGLIGRFFGAMFTKLGVPIPTQIGPKVLAQARDLCTGKTTADARHMTQSESFLERSLLQIPPARPDRVGEP